MLVLHQMPEIVARQLLITPSVAIRDVTCLGTCRHAGPEECATSTHLVFPYRGLFVRHLGRDLALADASQALFFNPSEGYRVSHPVPGGDASLDIVISEPLLRELAPTSLLKPGATLAFAQQRLRIDPALHESVVLQRRSTGVTGVGTSEVVSMAVRAEEQPSPRLLCRVRPEPSPTRRAPNRPYEGAHCGSSHSSDRARDDRWPLRQQRTHVRAHARQYLQVAVLRQTSTSSPTSMPPPPQELAAGSSDSSPTSVPELEVDLFLSTSGSSRARASVRPGPCPSVRESAPQWSVAADPSRGRNRAASAPAD